MGANAAASLEKPGLRAALLARRAAIPAAEREARSLRITEACTRLHDFSTARVVCAYLSFRDEVGTFPLVAGLLAEGRRVAVPAHRHGPGRPLVFVRIDSLEGLEPSHFGVPQPRPDALRVVPASEIALFIVPGVGFDLAGNRLGFGLGFYDRAFAGASPTARKVGLAFEAQIVDRLPAEPHDVRMDLVITEERQIAVPPGRGVLTEGGSRHDR